MILLLIENMENRKDKVITKTVRTQKKRKLFANLSFPDQSPVHGAKYTPVRHSCTPMPAGHAVKSIFSISTHVQHLHPPQRTSHRAKAMSCHENQNQALSLILAQPPQRQRPSQMDPTPADFAWAGRSSVQRRIQLTQRWE